MFLLSIDRPWWRSPFFFHRRHIKTRRQVALLRRSGIREVEIDPLRGLDVFPPTMVKSQAAYWTNQPQRSSSLSTVASPPPSAPPNTAMVVEELHKTLSEVATVANNLLTAMHAGAQPQTQVLTPLVHRLLECVSQDPEASTSLMKTRLSRPDTSSPTTDACALSLAVGKALGLETHQLLALGMGTFLHESAKVQQAASVIPTPCRASEADKGPDQPPPKAAVSHFAHLSQQVEQVRAIMTEIQKSGNKLDVRPESMETEIDRLSQIVSLIHTYLSLMNGSTGSSSLSSDQVRHQFQQLQLPAEFDPELATHVVRILNGPEAERSSQSPDSASPSPAPTSQPLAPIMTEPSPASHSTVPRILVAEENVLAQKMIVHMLSNLGYDADVVTPSPGVCEKVVRGSYAALLLDCPMPDTDAPMLHALRAQVDATGQGTALIAMTTNVLPEDKEHCLTAGMHDHLAKPFTQEELKAVLERWIQQGSPPPSIENPMEKSLPSLQGFKFEEALDHMGGDAALLQRVIGVFLDEYPQQLAHMHAAFQQQNAKALERLAHAFKGAAGNVGAVDVRQAALAIEQSATQNDHDQVRQALGVLEGELRQARPALESVRQHGLPSTGGSARPERQRSKKAINPGREIVVVIPMASLRITMVDILRGLGLRKIRQAGDGEKALELLHRKRADLVITDWNLPEKNGAELTRAIRDSAQLKHVPILIVTGSTTRDEVQEALSAGVNGYLLRPFTVEALEEKLLQFCP